MNKKQFFRVILTTILFVFLLNLFFGRFFAAKLSTLPLLNKWNILSPQGPIVINTREEIRVTDGEDIIEAVANVKSRLSIVVLMQSGQLSIAGYAVNLASEGLFLSPQSVFSSKSGEYYVVLSDGRRSLIKEKISDPATSAVFFSADLNAVPVAAWGESKQLKPGEKIIAVNNSLQTSVPQAQVLFVGRAQADIFSQNFGADYPSRSFGLQASTNLAAGIPLVNTRGEIVGISGEKGAVMSSDVLKKAADLYFNNHSKIVRPYFGFTFTQLTKPASILKDQPEGAIVLTIDRSGKVRSPALDAGLVEKDVIVSVDGQALSENLLLEEVFQKYKPNDQIKLIVLRGKETKTLSLSLKTLEK